LNDLLLDLDLERDLLGVLEYDLKLDVDIFFLILKNVKEGQRFSPGTLVSYSNKTGHHDIAKIL
jgi:hypothetical protein